MASGQNVVLSKRIFDKYDFDGSGKITIVEFREMVYELGYYLSERELQMAMLMLDVDGDGSVSYPEFQKWWRTDDRFKKLQLTDEQYNLMQYCASYFQWFDKDLNGVLNREEFLACHSDLVRNRVTDASFEKCFATLDSNSDGAISFNEYIDWLIAIGSINLSSDDTTLVAPAAASPASPVETEQELRRSEDEKEITRSLKLRLQRAETILQLHADSQPVKDPELKSYESTLQKISADKASSADLSLRQARVASMRMERLSFYRASQPAAIAQQLARPGGEAQLSQRLRMMREQSEAFLKKPLDDKCAHQFARCKFKTPTYCYYCAKRLWGDAKTGYRCKGCHYIVHDGTCRDLVDPRKVSRQQRRLGIRERIKNRSRSPKNTDQPVSYTHLTLPTIA